MRGFTNGLFEWLRKAPWKDPGFSSLVLSVVVFGFVVSGRPAGLEGAASEQKLLLLSDGAPNVGEAARAMTAQSLAIVMPFYLKDCLGAGYLGRR